MIYNIKNPLEGGRFMAYPIVAVISLVIASVIAFFICHNEQAEEGKIINFADIYTARDAA